MMRKTIFTILILMLIILIGCGEKECSDDNDCNDNLRCTKDVCEKGTCTHQRMDNCFRGDGICDSSRGESKCTVPEDCGTCGAERTNYTYLTYVCDSEDQCRLGIQANEVKQKSVSERYIPRRGGPSIEYSIEYEEPFNSDTSTFYFNIELADLPDGYSEVAITRVQVYELSDDRRNPEKDVLGSHGKEYPLRQIGSSIELSLPLKISESTMEKSSNIGVAIQIRYKELFRGEQQVQTDEIDKVFTKPLIVLNPQAVAACPDSCDDGNSCTLDSCPEGKGYCVHEFDSTKCCGNYVCEDGENSCTCPNDCGACENKISRYTEYMCKSNECVSRIKDSANIRSVTKSDDSRVGDFTIIHKYTYTQPFDLRTENLTLSAEIASIGEATKLKITNVQILTRSEELIGEKLQDFKFNDQVGSRIEMDVPIDFTISGTEETKELTVKFFYEFEKVYREEPIIQYTTFTYALGTTEFIETEI